MRLSYDNNLLTSIYLYSQYRVQQIGQAYQTLTMRLFPTVDPTLPAGYQGYSSPLKGWLYDNGVSGAHVIQSVSGGGFSAPLTRMSGIVVDYPNGRIIMPTALGVPTQPLTGTASVTQVNHYAPSEIDEQTLLTQSKMFLNPRTVYSMATSGAPPNVFVTPAIFVNPLNTVNDAHALGGMVMTKSTVTLTVFAEDPNQLTAILGIWRDARYGYFPLVNALNYPLDRWGDVVGGTGFNYLTLVQTFGQPGNLVYIEDVRTARVSDRARVNDAQWVGIVDVDTCYLRQAPASNIFV